MSKNYKKTANSKYPIGMLQFYLMCKEPKLLALEKRTHADSSNIYGISGCEARNNNYDPPLERCFKRKKMKQWVFVFGFIFIFKIDFLDFNFY
jgi:hypothetical protein